MCEVAGGCPKPQFLEALRNYFGLLQLLRAVYTSTRSTLEIAKKGNVNAAQGRRKLRNTGKQQ